MLQTVESHLSETKEGLQPDCFSRTCLKMYMTGYCKNFKNKFL